MAAPNSVSSTLATIVDVVIGINGAKNLTNVVNNETKYELKPIDGLDIFYEASFFVHLLGTLYLLFKTLTEKKCEGNIIASYNSIICRCIVAFRYVHSVEKRPRVTTTRYTQRQNFIQNFVIVIPQCVMIFFV